MRFRLPFALTVVLLAGFAPAPPPRPEKRPTSVLGRLEGTWIIEAYGVGGIVQGGPAPKWEKVVIQEGRWSLARMEGNREQRTTPYVIALDPQRPANIDMAYEWMKKPLIFG